MFNRIAHRYDLLNRLMSGGLDLLWRRRAVRAIDPRVLPRVIDVCTGTGDIALALSKRGHRVIAIDAAHDMLTGAQKRSNADKTLWIEGDAVRLPLPTASVDALTISFGVRNIADRSGALREFARVVRPNGRIVVLEALSPMSRSFGTALRLYESLAFPILGWLLAGDRRAYEYLARSIAGFGSADEFRVDLIRAGWSDISVTRFVGGSVGLFVATRSPQTPSKSID